MLLLLLISDTAVLVLPSEAVPPALLQLLHVLDTVYKAILKQPLHGRQQQQQQDAADGLAQLLKSRQQPVQLHIALQVTGSYPMRLRHLVQKVTLSSVSYMRQSIA